MNEPTPNATAAAQNPIDLTGKKLTLLEGDFKARCAELADGCIDLVFTTIPHQTSVAHTITDIFDAASRLLKDGGNMLILSDQSILPLFHTSPSVSLRYEWTLSVTIDSTTSRGIATQWRPLLWFTKGSGSSRCTISNDMILGKSTGKKGDDADIAVCQSIIGLFSKENNIVLNPLMTDSALAVTSLNRLRRFVGVSRDNKVIEAVKTATQTITDQGGVTPFSGGVKCK